MSFIRNEFLKNILLALVSAFIAFLVLFAIGEVARRLKEPSWALSMDVKYQPYVFARHILKPGERVAKSRNHPEWEYHINNHGYRGNNFSIEKPPGQVRLLFYGGSHVFDSRSKPPSWPELAEKILHNRGYNQVEIINGGTPGHASPDSLGKFYSRGHFLQPDYVFLIHGWNDLKYFNVPVQFPLYSMHPYNPDDNKKKNYRNSIDRFLGEHSQLYFHLRTRFYSHLEDWESEGRRYRGRHFDTLDEKAVTQFELTVKQFVSLAREKNAVPVLVSQARLVADNNGPEEKNKISFNTLSLTYQGMVRGFRTI